MMLSKIFGNLAITYEEWQFGNQIDGVLIISVNYYICILSTYIYKYLCTYIHANTLSMKFDFNVVDISSFSFYNCINKYKGESLR